VTWKGRDSLLGIPGAVKLRFHLRNAELYSFQFVPAENGTATAAAPPAAFSRTIDSH